MELVDINPTRGKSPAKLDMAIPFPDNLNLGTNELQKPLASKVVATPYVLKISNANGSNFIRHRHLQENGGESYPGRDSPHRVMAKRPDC